MARGEFTVKARIEAEDRASAQLSRIGAGFRNFGSFLSRSFVITLGDVSRAIRGTFAALSSFVDAASESEDAVSKLNSAFSVYGSVAADASKAALAQAAAIQKTTKFTDEAVISAQALLATYNVSAQQIPKATQAVVDLAAALGVSLESAAAQLGGTLSGVISRDIGRLAPELRKMDDAALQAGEGISLLADKLEGRAAAAGKTFSGVVERIRNSLGEYQEEVGRAITENESIRQSFDDLNTTLQKTPALVNLLATTLGAFARGVADTLKNTNAEVEAIGRFVDRLTNLKDLLVGAVTLEDDYAEKIAKTSQAHVEAVAAVDARAAGEQRLADILKAESDSFDLLSTKAKDLGITLDATLNKALEKNAATLISAENAARQGIITWNDYEKIADAVAVSFNSLSVKAKELGVSLDSTNRELEKNARTLIEAENAARNGIITWNDYQNIADAVATSFNSLASNAKELGVTLESTLNRAFEKNAATLIEAEKAARNGVITWRDFEAIQRAVAEANQEVTKELTGVTQAAAKTSQAYTALTANGKGVVVSLQQQAAQALITARTFDLLAQSTGRAAAVEAAVASGGTLIQGGTRIRFGSSSSQSGSRLVAAPGFMGSSGPTYRGGFGWAVGIGYGGYGASVGMNAPVYGYR